MHETQYVILLHSSVTTTELKPPVPDPGSVRLFCCIIQVFSVQAFIFTGAKCKSKGSLV